MIAHTTQDVLPVLQDMIALELALADLYGACGAKFPEDRELWSAIQRQEEGHAEFLRRLADLMAARPGEFRPGRPFNSTAIRTVLTSVTAYADQVKRGQLPRQRALFVARDIEKSVLEANYVQIVNTENAEYLQAMDTISRETRSHRDLLAAAVARAGA